MRKHPTDLPAKDAKKRERKLCQEILLGKFFSDEPLLEFSRRRARLILQLS
jgi:hypothetical protein